MHRSATDSDSSLLNKFEIIDFKPVHVHIFVREDVPCMDDYSVQSV